MEYEVLVEMSEDAIKVNLSILLNADDKVYYYLCTEDGRILARSGWKSDSNYVFDTTILETNCLFVKAFLLRNGEKYVKKSEWFDYIARDDIARFNNFCKEERDYGNLANLDPFHLFHPKQPYSNFCFLFGDLKDKAISKFCNDYDFECIYLCGKGVLIKEKAIDYKKEKAIFSGIGRIGDNLIVGNSNISDIEIKEELSDQVGTFTFFKETESGIEIGTDYFGIGKIYYFMEEADFICGNNYHMLLLLLKYIEKKLEINESIINALMCKMNQPFAQRFCRECEIKNILILPVGNKFRIVQKVELIDTSISQAFNTDRDITNSEYLELIQRGKDEILSNINAVLTCEHYNEIVLELTGGLDTRTVYAALTNFDIKDKNVFVDTIEWADLQKDVKVATQVNSVYELPWDTRSRVIRKKDYEVVQNNINSHFLLGGGYFFPLDYLPSKYNPLTESLEGEEKTICLNGYYGEICCRPYFTRDALNRYDDIEEYGLEQLLPIIIHKKDILSVKMYQLLTDVMKKELEQLPGKSYIEKYEAEYLFYRNSFHCTRADGYEARGTWGCIQSKSLHYLCRKMYGKKKDIKVQLDIINELNPVFGCIPYESLKDNQAKSLLLDELYYPDERFRHATLELKNGREKWEEAQYVVNEKLKVISEGNLLSQEIDKKNGEWIEGWKERFEILLHGLMQYQNGLFQKQFGVDVYVSFIVKKNKTEPFYKTLYNKLLAIWLQLRIIDHKYNDIFEKEDRKALLSE